ncbi:hypothetical protein BC830DRAFT_1132649 [Chytriomyces sp. MP71]|nr:hypothetical protein BC830DRAFT_1132649 [Chytriomyces sp. MP71]
MYTTPRIIEVTPGCFNLRAPFQILAGMVDVGTHMSFVRLESGKFLVLSTVQLDDEAKKEVMELTKGGELIEAVVATNPFHTLYFELFAELFPNAKFYGTPRHMRNYPNVPWVGNVDDEKVLKLWAPEIELEWTAGCEIVNPQPESINHFAGVVAFHRASRTIICDDCFKVSMDPGFIERNVFGRRNHEISFHMSLWNHALLNTPTSVQEFYDWVVKIMKEWDFDNISTAHGGVMVGDAKKELGLGLKKAEDALAKMAVTKGGLLVTVPLPLA